jgi:hypothetical protein
LPGSENEVGKSRPHGAGKLATPGAMLVLLRRDVRSTRVLIDRRDQNRTPFAFAAARGDVGQWSLTEALCRSTWANEVSRLYASELLIDTGRLRAGVFIGFLDDDADDAPLPPEHEWRDLRQAARDLSEPWSSLLRSVRAGFIAQSPDEALRLR